MDVNLLALFRDATFRGAIRGAAPPDPARMSGDDFAAAEENGDAADAPDLFKWLSREVRELMPREVPVLETPPTALAFSRDFVAANRPCVVRGAVDHWPARELWTASYLSAALGDTLISVNVTPTGLGDALLSTEGVDLRYRERAGASGASSSSSGDANDQRPKKRDDEDPNAPREKPPLVFVQPEARRMSFREFQALAREDAREPKNKTHLSSGLEPRQIPYVSAQDDSFASEFSARVGGDLGADAARGLEWARDAFGSAPDAVNVWCGVSDAVTSFHRDHYENVYVVLRGSKTFTLLPPCDAWRVAPRIAPAARFEYDEVSDDVSDDDAREDSAERSSGTRKKPVCRVVVETPITHVSWPSATPASLRRDGGPKPLVVTVRAGETLYLPAMWYHHVEQRRCSSFALDARFRADESDEFAIAVNFWHDMRFDDRFATARFLETASEREKARREETDE